MVKSPTKQSKKALKLPRRAPKPPMLQQLKQTMLQQLKQTMRLQLLRQRKLLHRLA